MKLFEENKTGSLHFAGSGEAGANGFNIIINEPKSKRGSVGPLNIVKNNRGGRSSSLFIQNDDLNKGDFSHKNNKTKEEEKKSKINNQNDIPEKEQRDKVN